MNSIKKRLIAGLGSALLVTGLAVAVPATASAETYSASCKGSYVTTKTVENVSGTVIGRVGVYRDGNYMCAVLVKAGPVYGVPTFTELSVSSAHDDGVDSGRFSYRTDAIRVYAPWHQIHVSATVAGRNGNLNWLGIDIKG